MKLATAMMQCVFLLSPHTTKLSLHHSPDAMIRVAATIRNLKMDFTCRLFVLVRVALWTWSDLVGSNAREVTNYSCGPRAGTVSTHETRFSFSPACIGHRWHWGGGSNSLDTATSNRASCGFANLDFWQTTLDCRVTSVNNTAQLRPSRHVRPLEASAS